MYTQIKTVVQHDVSTFDAHVNEHLSSGEGWRLIEYKLVLTNGNGYHYAHLEREVMEEQDKECDNCRHCDTHAGAPPCCYCDDASQWEPEAQT